MTKLATDIEDLCAELRTRDEEMKTEMKARFEDMLKTQRQAATTQRQATVIEATLVRVEKNSDEVRKEFERRVHILERDMTNRIDGDGAFQEAINKKVAVVTDTHTVLNTSVQNYSKNLSTFKKEREDKDTTVKKKLDDLSQGLQQANAKVCDVQQQKLTADEVLKRATRTDDIVDAQDAKFQEIEEQLAGQKSFIDELQVATTTRDDEFWEW
jgi:hypothetical protein